ncbi:MAG TPA: hypothetical protein VMT18_13700, partial [Planctomycetota bacterium]|nr:hypothetical protein [Planctomycetota bacterium]
NEGGDPLEHEWPMNEIGVPPLGDGGDMWEFCMRWVYQSIDSGFGEDHYQSGHLMKSRGVKLVIDHPDWAKARTLYASDDNGCFKFEAPQNTGYVITMFAEAKLGEDENLAVRAYDTVSQALANKPEEVAQWTIHANPGGSPRRVYYQNEPGPESDLMAFGSFMVHWIDHKTSPRLAGEHTMRMASDGTGCGGSCQSGNTVRIQPGAEQRKFLVGHEVGHWLHRTWTNDQLGLFAYGANSGDPDCAFVGVGEHAMRSKEYAGGALIEGFAQYLAALAWNDHDEQDGWFKYYKEVNNIAYEDMQAGNWRVDVEGDGINPVGGVSNWMANKCTVHDGHSVEMDWMRFWWDYRTDGVKWTRPGHHDLFEHLLYTADNDPWLDVKDAFDRLLDTINDPGLGQTLYAARFSQKAIQNGVAQ